MHSKKIRKENIIASLIGFLKRTPFIISLIAVISTIFDYGIYESFSTKNLFFWIYSTTIVVGVIATSNRYFSSKNRPKHQVLTFDTILLFFLVFLLLYNFKWIYFDFFDYRIWLQIGSFLIFIREYSVLNFNLKKNYFKPAQLFILSFLFIILLGTTLLMLPHATHNGISFINALFTSTSAVCVTGLVVVDTGSYFTQFGQVILIILMQLGGIGIMTFASFFTYFFKGNTSYKNRLILSDMNNSDKIAEVFNILRKIILVTFSIEAIGTIFIYRSLDKTLITTVGERLFFSIFHAVSGFCNAGFSTLTNNLYETGFRFNYSLHIIIALLIIIGGIGFPIIFNFFKYIKHIIFNRFLPASRKEKIVHIPWVININTKLVVLTSSLLIVFGTLFFYILEYNNTLAEHHGFGKIITAFFGAVTPRTAGFNTIDSSALAFPTILLIIFLMWIGASPASTGGGIKTSTFAIGILNFFSIARGKNRVEVFSREIANISIKRAFAIISLSLIVIGLSVFFITIFDSDKDMLSITFECFSAYSTVGLSLGITNSLSDASKLILVITMFIGRVSMLTILIAMLKKVKHMKYSYPTEEILIN